MTETDWLTDTDYHRHVEFVENRLRSRRARLLGVAFCRDVLHLFDDDGMRAALDVIEGYADGEATRDELEAARSWAREAAVKVSDVPEPSDLDATRLYNLRNEFAWAVAFAAQSPVSLLHVG